MLIQEYEAASDPFRTWADRHVLPHADRWDREERISDAVIEGLAGQGYLGALIPSAYGGAEMPMIRFGLLNKAIGRACSSVRSIVTVHSMVSQALARWGTVEQKHRWLRPMASGVTLAAFALTEPAIGSDARHVTATATRCRDGFVLNGTKRWITGAQIAHLFLVFAQCDGAPAAFLVERQTPGLRLVPSSGILGIRASMLAELKLTDCRVPPHSLLGAPGVGFSHVAALALHCGRYSVAWGCVGIAEACLDASLQYTSERQQFGVPLREHQLIRQMISDMITNTRAATLLCAHAGELMDVGDPDAIRETYIAKYFASTAATRAASDALQIHGANGCSSDYPVSRLFRDARIMEIIEGTTQIQQITIADHAYGAVRA